MRMMKMMVMMVMMVMVLLDFTNCVQMLPPPSTVSMDSINMRHVLRWRPLQASCNATVLYSVQFQGEFELLVLNGTWVDSVGCQRTPHIHCDLSLDLGSDSDYNLRVRAQCGSLLSPWTQLSPAFNRRDTLLMAPEMAVKVVGGGLHVSFDKLPLTSVVAATVWKRGNEAQAELYSVPAEQKSLSVAALQEGAEYCVRAQTVVAPGLHSNSTDSQCVALTAPEPSWKMPTTVVLTVVVVTGLLFAVFWSVVHCRLDACQTYFQKVALPRSLEFDSDAPVQVSGEEAELCDQVHVVLMVDS